MPLLSPIPTLNTLHRAQTSLNTSVRRLSTGLRINSAKDDPAGLIAATHLQSSLSSVQSDRAAGQRDYYAAMVADASYAGISALFTEAKSLLLKSTAGPTLSSTDRDGLQTQLDAILEAVDRLSSSVSLDGRQLLNGTTTLGHPGTPDSPGTSLSLPRIDTQSLTLPPDPPGVVSSPDHVSSTPPDDEPPYSLADLSSTGRLSLSAGNPELAQKVLDAASSQLNDARAKLGGYMRYSIQSWGNVLDITEENLTAALSQIQDTDYATETANVARQQALIQSSTALLAIQSTNAHHVLSLLS